MAIDEAPPRFPFPAAAPGLELPEEFARLRREEPVARVTLPTGDSAWLVTRYADARAVLSDVRFSRAAAEQPGAPRVGHTRPGPMNILGMDPPDHTRLRRLVSPAFSARRIEALRPHVATLADDLVRAAVARPRPVDLLAHVTYELPSRVIFELLGVPYADFDQLHEWSEVIFSMVGHAPGEVAAARRKIQDYLGGLIAVKRAEPTEDLLGVLIRHRDEGDRLTEPELIEFALILITVGHMSTAGTLGAMLYTLLLHPDQLAALRRRPELVPAAVEELLRHNTFTLTGAQLRVAVADIELGGVTIRAGDAVLTALGSANHDPVVFADAGRLDLDRAAEAHLAFGHGIHYCLGASLARLELQEAFRSLMRHLPATVHLAAEPRQLEIKTGLTARALVELPVDW
ncbi:cytochrome P450 [Actinoplanes sp. N902-109]|uniref:cytochrome P450 n=1 Tax=Actinoplanes sp. (strain N902-109) TaxID=649831 RepID=UPI000329562B|nr:cytochrome P450 [Actinoplanes sp. N902-109]AGL16627.1 cytochrome P450, nitric oxide reductase [Actinoplanes sp. N902-109]